MNVYNTFTLCMAFLAVVLGGICIAVAVKQGGERRRRYKNILQMVFIFLEL